MNVELLFFGFLTGVAGVGYFIYHRWYERDDPTNDIAKSDWELVSGPCFGYDEYDLAMVTLVILTIVLLVLGFSLPNSFVYNGT